MDKIHGQKLTYKYEKILFVCRPSNIKESHYYSFVCNTINAFYGKENIVTKKKNQLLIYSINNFIL